MGYRIHLRSVFILVMPLVAGLAFAFTVSSIVKANGRSAVEISQSPEASTVIYVSTTGDGSDPELGFDTGLTSLQDAIGKILPGGGEIWVASGVYYPDEGALQSEDDPTSTFEMTDTIKLYGGFDIKDTQFSERDPQVNLTVLSGDIDKNDITDPMGVVTHTDNITGTNAYHVVSAREVTTTAVLDGFTITAGKASGVAADANGAGFLCNGTGSGNHCSPTLANLVFSGNLAQNSGGAMYNLCDEGNCGLSLNNVLFRDNSAAGGGAVYNSADEGTCSFYLNGGGFTGNSGFNSGGAVYNFADQGTINFDLVGVDFLENSSYYGGAVTNYAYNGTINPAYSYVNFIGNSATYGGAIYDSVNEGAINPDLKDIYFSGNSAGFSGGAVYNSLDDSTYNSSVENTVFSGNFSESSGGVIYNVAQSSTCNQAYTNVSFSGNRSGGYGGAVFNSGPCSPLLQNSVIWNNQDQTGIGTLSASIQNHPYIPLTVKHSLVQGTGGSGDNWVGVNGFVDGGGNIDLDPHFLQDILPSSAPTTSGNLRLKFGSPAIDAGSDELIPTGVTEDLDKKPRQVDGNGDGDAVVDMGAFESGIAYRLVVNKTGSGDGMVFSKPQGVNCGDTCSIVLPDKSKLMLEVAPDSFSIFAGWSDACSGADDCSLNLDASKNVTATFSLKQYALTVNLAGSGSGTVTSQPAGINCGGDCSEDYNYNKKVALTAAADPGSTFTGWGGACSGIGACEVSMTAAKTVSAEFTAAGFEIYLPVEFR